MESKEIRKKFLEFFNKNNHPIIESSSLIPQGDPSLLFTSAGMVQFKAYYLGLKDDMKRAASCQKCFRTTDIDNVGKTIRHLTFFEMLGNFSFGDYFKEESLKWGYEFLTKEMRIKPERMYFSIYKGGIAPRDEEAYQIWKRILPPNLHSHIFELGEDNFWSMGETGPSGPCSEIYYDRGEKFSHSGCLGPGCSCDRYIEIWNHVFTQFDRQKDNSFKPLPKKNIDTGMGLERLSFIVENKYSPFETSLFYPIIRNFIEQNINKVNDAEKIYLEKIVKYLNSPEDFHKYVIIDTPYNIIPNLRIIADHLRGASFLISEGIIPSNEGRGYILRRLIRRAERFGMVLGIKEPFLYNLIEAVISIFKETYPQLNTTKEYIKSTLKFEEEGFLETLENGEKYLNELISKNENIDGENAFKLYETYGFPLELIREIALKNNLKIDEERFYKAKEKAQDISRSAWKSSGEKNAFIFQKAEEKLPHTIFTGYEKYEDTGNIIAILDLNGNLIEKAEEGELYLVFDKTPFYAESGGQIADTGEIFFNKEKIAIVLDVQKPIGNVFYHKVKILKKIENGINVELKIDKIKRIKTAANHTATHLINAALKNILGENTRQAGSMVSDEKFRFDYTATKTTTNIELKEIENIANKAIIEGYKVFKQIRPLEDAKKLGATILLGEKYSDPARFVLINKDGFENPKERYSLELCGGTHVDDLKEVFFIKILKDSSLSRGIRRIEGVAGYSAIDYLKNTYEIANNISEISGVNLEELPERISKMKEEIKNLKKEIHNLKSIKLNKNQEEKEIKIKNDITLILKEEKEFDIKLLREISDRYKNERKNSVIFIFSRKDEKINFIFSLSNDLKGSDLDANIIAKKIADKFSGKAGGRKDFAQGGGILKKGTKDILPEIVEILQKS